MISSILFWMASLIIGFPFFIAICKRNITPNPLRIMKFHLAIASLLQLSIILLYFFEMNRKFLFHIYIVEEFTFDMLFYRELLKKTHSFKDRSIKRKIFLLLMVLFITFSLLNAFYIGDIKKFPTYPFIIQCTIMIIVTSWYNYIRNFYEPSPIIHSELSSFKLYKEPVFWMNKGKLLYYSTSLPIFILYNIAIEEKLNSIILATWIIQSIFLILLHISMGIGFLKYKSSPTDVADMEQKLKKQL